MTKDAGLRMVLFTLGPALPKLDYAGEPYGDLVKIYILIQQVQAGYCIFKEPPRNARLLAQGPHFNK